MQTVEDMNLVLSADAKPRLKWTAELHQRFVDAVNHLGGVHKATPKSLMRVMGINGLTLYHLKSHLQKHRLGKSQQSETNAQEDEHFNGEISDRIQNHIANKIETSKALEIQMEVQRKLQEQIEVQKHLQLRIEAQGKYLQRVLIKAQETIAGHGCCSEALEQAKAELSQLASTMVNSGCQSSSLSELTDSSTEMNFSGVERFESRRRRMGSIESCLTSGESLEEAIKVKKRRREEQRSSVSESDEDEKELRMIDLNDDEGIEMGSKLIEFL